ncbi:MAG: MATE family efflux transporter [Erysipelotrichaceae bacterium]|nr:MATE family efflux transporter [Erysipelotrichaceae bacterium]
MLKEYFGDKEFYKRVAWIALPVALQQLLSSAMGIVDSIMVSWIDGVTAVGTASQIENICITLAFGGVTGIGIFAAQFYGAKEYDNMKRTFGLSLLYCGIIGVVFYLAVTFFGREICLFYIEDEAVVSSALEYLAITRYAYLPMCLAFCFSYQYRCVHKTTVPLILGVVGMMTNVVLNYLLIFGKFGCPELGVAGAAIGTLVAQCVSLFLYVVYTLKKKMVFAGSPKVMFDLPVSFVKPIVIRSYPLVLNEFFFSFGASMYIKAYGLLGKLATDSYYVGNQINNIFFSACNGLVSATGVVLGASLGENDKEKAIRQSKYFIGMAGVLSIALSLIIIWSAKGLVSLFGLQNPVVHDSAVMIVRICGIRIMLRLFNATVFSSLRAGGDSKFLVFLDSGIMWAIGIPLAYFIILGLHIRSIVWVYFLVQAENIVRLVIGLRRFSSYKWVNNLTTEVK